MVAQRPRSTSSRIESTESISECTFSSLPSDSSWRSTMPRCRLVISSGMRASWCTSTTGPMRMRSCETSAKGSASSGCSDSARPDSGLVTTAMSMMPRSSQSSSAGVKASRVRSVTPSSMLAQFSNSPGSSSRASVGDAPSTTVAWSTCWLRASFWPSRAASASMRCADSYTVMPALVRRTPRGRRCSSCTPSSDSSSRIWRVSAGCASGMAAAAAVRLPASATATK